MGTLKQNSNTSTLKSTDDMKMLMQYVLDTSKKLGATDASVSVNHDSGYSVDVRMGEVDTVEFSEDQGVAVTVYHGHQKGSASSTDTSKEAIDKMVLSAYDIAKVSAEDPCYGLADKHLMNNHLPDLSLNHPWNLELQDAIDTALSCEASALGFDKRIKNSDGVGLSTHTFHHGYANSNGCEVVLKSSRHGMSCSLIAEDKGRMQRDYDYTTARDHFDLMNPEDLAKSAAQRTIARLGARKITTQKTPIIFSSRLSSSLMSSFISAISGSNLYRKNSFLLNNIGEKIFPDFINIYEKPLIPKALGSSPIDGEGVPTRNNHFVEDGTLMQYVLGCYSARKLGLETTANSDGVHNLIVNPTCGGLDEMLQEMGSGLLVTELMGHGTSILTGDYSRGAGGFWVENGQIQFPVEEVTIAGNLKNIFRGIRAVGHDINPNISTQCGSLWIDEMMVGGE